MSTPITNAQRALEAQALIKQILAWIKANPTKTHDEIVTEGADLIAAHLNAAAQGDKPAAIDWCASDCPF